MKLATLFSVFAFALFYAESARADFVIDFTNNVTGNQFQNDVVNDTAGPFTDTNNNLVRTLTTRGFENGQALSRTGNGLGVTNQGSGANAFNNGEAWSFSFGGDVFLKEIAFNNFENNIEIFTIQSSAFAGQTFTPTGNTVSFAGDTITIGQDNLSSSFGLDSLFGGELVRISQGTQIKIGYELAGGVSSNESAHIQSITFAADSSAVPEPAHLSLAAFGLLGWMYKRRRKSIKNKEDQADTIAE